MKNFYLAAPMALAMTACVDNPPDIQIFNAYVPDAACAVNITGAASGGGSLDLSTSSRYLTGLSVRSGVSSSEVVVNDGPVTGGADSAAIYVTHIELTYETQGSGPTLEPEVYTSHFSIPSNATTNSVLVVDLLGANALQTLSSQLAGGASATVNVQLKLIGKTVTGAKAESNEIAYPITFYASGFTCPERSTLERNGPCGGTGGQDGFAPTCTEPEPEPEVVE